MQWLLDHLMFMNKAQTDRLAEVFVVLLVLLVPFTFTALLVESNRLFLKLIAIDAVVFVIGVGVGHSYFGKRDP